MEPYYIAYDVDAKKVGCVLIQAALGGTLPKELYFTHFPTETWTVNASNCRLYPITEEQLPALAARTER